MNIEEIIPESNLAILCDIDLIEKDRELIAHLTGIIDLDIYEINLN